MKDKKQICYRGEYTDPVALYRHFARTNDFEYVIYMDITRTDNALNSNIHTELKNRIASLNFATISQNAYPNITDQWPNMKKYYEGFLKTYTLLVSITDNLLELLS